MNRMFKKNARTDPETSGPTIGPRNGEIVYTAIGLAALSDG